MELYGCKTGIELSFYEYVQKIKATYPEKIIVWKTWSNSFGVFFYFNEGRDIVGSDTEIGIWTNDKTWGMTVPDTNKMTMVDGI